MIGDEITDDHTDREEVVETTHDVGHNGDNITVVVVPGTHSVRRNAT